MAEVGINVTCGITWWKLVSMSPVELRGGSWYQCHLWYYVVEIGINVTCGITWRKLVSMSPAESRGGS
jgi:hypothetical protein